MVTALMGADLNSILKCQKLTDEHVQFLVYQILRGLKVCNIKTCRNPLQLHPQELKKAFKNLFVGKQTWQPFGYLRAKLK